MTSFEVLLKSYAELPSEARYPFLAAKMNTVLGYCKHWPALSDHLHIMALKVIAADGILDENELGIMNAISMIYEGSTIDIKKFFGEIAAFAETGYDTTAADAAFSMLPEFAKDDIITIGIALAAIDGVVAVEEAEYLESLC